LNEAVPLLALSTGHKVGLLVMALILIGFALFSSFVAPRIWPDYPGKGLNVFIVVSVVLFALMIGSVEIFGAESEEANAKEPPPAVQAAKHRIPVALSEWKITLPPGTGGLPAGPYTFHVTNKGKVPHNLTVNGPGVSNEATPNISPGNDADLEVTLEKGTYDLYCSIPGHKQLGMDTKLTIG
jgi:uncharacterized cupredoxin-like copper-binding protein